MASIIRIKRSSGILAPSSLKTAELAYAYGVGTQANKGDRLFIGTGDNGAGGATAITVIGGSYFTDMLDHVSGTLTASSAIIVDSDKKIDQLLSGSIVIDGVTNSITTPGKILYANLYDSLGALPSASTYHGMFAHVHGTGKGYYSHAGGWIELANKDSINAIDSSFTSFNNNIDNTIDSHLSSTVNVVVGSYGSQIAIPTLKVDSGGRIDSIGTVPLLTTLSFTADSGTGDSVNLRDSVLNFSGSNSIITKVTDSGIDIRLDSARPGPHLAVKGAAYPGLYTFGGGSSNAEISIDDFGIVKTARSTNILAELTIKDDSTGGSPTEHKLFTTQNDLVLKGGPGITVGMTGPTHSIQGQADNADGVYTISVDSGLDIQANLLRVGGDSGRGWASGLPGYADPNAPSNSHVLLPATFQQAGNAVLGLAKDNAQNFTTVQFFDSEGGNFHMGPEHSSQGSGVSNPIYGVNPAQVVGHWQARNPNFNLGTIEKPWRGTALDKNLDFTAVSGSYMSMRENNDSSFSIRSRNNFATFPIFTTLVNYNTARGLGSQIEYHVDQRVNIDKYIYFGDSPSHGYIGKESTDQWLNILNGGTGIALYGGILQLNSTANTGFKVIEAKGSIKPVFSPGELFDIGDSLGLVPATVHRTFKDAYFSGTVNAGNIQLTSGGISVNSGGNIVGDSARFDVIHSRTGQNMTIAPNTDSGGTITIGTRYGFSSAQGNHKLDLTNVGLSAGLIKGEAVGTTSFGSWAIPFQSTNLFNDLGFRGGQSHINILDNQDSALTITAMTNLGAATADMVTFNTKDSVTNFHRDVNIAADKFLKLGTLASIRQETVDNQLQIINNGTTSIMGTSVELISSANNPFKSVQVQGHIRPVFQGGGVTFDIGQSTSNTWNNAFFSGNVTSRTNATDSDHLVLKRQLDSDITSVTLDSASWDKDNHNLNLTIGGNVTQVTINEFDNVKIDGNTISSTDSSNQLFIDPFPVGDSGDLVIRGNLIVQGTETTVNSTVVSLNDKNLVLADSAANSGVADGAGITIGGAQYSGTKPQFVFDAATDRWDPNLPFDIPFASLDSAIFFNGVALREVVEDHLDNFFGVDSNAALTLTYNDVANTMTWKANNATKSQVGVSSFDSSNFSVTAGHVAVTVLDGGTY